MNWHCPSSLQLIINDLNDIAADAYRHRIRPRSKKGGNGVYDTSNGGFPYLLPRRHSFNNRAHFEVVKSEPDRIVLRATSLQDQNCFVTATVDLRGRLTNISTPGEAISKDPPLRQMQSRGSLEAPAPMLQLVKVFEDL